MRFIGDAQARISEDYLRILRFFRFNAYYGKSPLDEAGLSACVKQRGGLAQLSAERVCAELKRILIAPQALAAVEALFDYGLLTDILGSAPRLRRLSHLIYIETALSREPNAVLRLAALAVFVAEDAPRLAARFKLSNAEQAVLALAADQALDPALPEESAAKRLLYRLGPERFSLQALLTWAARGAAADDPEWGHALTLPERWQAPPLPVRGPDLVQFDLEGPALGEMLRALEQHWIDGGFALSREELIAHAADLSQKLSKRDR